MAREGGHEWQSSSDPELVRWVVELNRETLFLDMADPVARRRGRRLAPVQRRRGCATAATASRPTRSGSPAGSCGSSSAATGCSSCRSSRTCRAAPLRPDDARNAHRRVAAGPVRDGRGRFRRRTRADAPLADDDARTASSLHPFGSIVTNRVANARLQARIAPGDGTLWLVMRLGTVGGAAAKPPAGDRSFSLDQCPAARASCSRSCASRGAGRRLLTSSETTYKLLFLPGFERARWRFGKWHAWLAAERARRHVPRTGSSSPSTATRASGRAASIPTSTILPVTDKANYVARFSIEERCRGGAIPPLRRRRRRVLGDERHAVELGSRARTSCSR